MNVYKSIFNAYPITDSIDDEFIKSMNTLSYA